MLPFLVTHYLCCFHLFPYLSLRPKIWSCKLSSTPPRVRYKLPARSAVVAASLDSHVASVMAVARGRTKHGVSSVLQETVEYLTSTCKPPFECKQTSFAMFTNANIRAANLHTPKILCSACRKHRLEGKGVRQLLSAENRIPFWFARPTKKGHCTVVRNHLISYLPIRLKSRVPLS